MRIPHAALFALLAGILGGILVGGIKAQTAADEQPVERAGGMVPLPQDPQKAGAGIPEAPPPPPPSDEAISESGRFDMVGSVCMGPTAFCVGTLDSPYATFELGPSSGAMEGALWLNWTPTTPASGRLRLELLACEEDLQGSGENCLVVGEWTDGGPTALNARSAAAEFDFSEIPPGATLHARVTSQTMSLTGGMTLHAAYGQPFELNGWIRYRM